MKNINIKYTVFFMILLLLLSVNIFIGADLKICKNIGVSSEILFKIRIPRALITVIAGSTFALCGAVFQSLFRNPIASPFTLGTAAGASFGVTIYITFLSGTGLLQTAFSSLFALAGALLSVSIVYMTMYGRKKFTPNTIILSGVIINFFFSGLILFIQYIASQANAVRITRWTMGSLNIIGTESLFFSSIIFVAGSVYIYKLRDELNLMSLGQDISVSRGVNVMLSGKKLFLTSSLMISSVVAVTGPIGFIGVIAPHIASSFFGRNYRLLLPASMITGASLLLFCDFISRSLIWPAEIPVGIITALVGALFFLKIVSK